MDLHMDIDASSTVELFENSNATSFLKALSAGIVSESYVNKAVTFGLCLCLRHIFVYYRTK